MNNKCAFCVPLHPKHFDYGYYIYEQLRNSDADLYFIFTNLEEKELFYSKMNKDNNLNALIVADFCDINILEKNRSFISVKKLYALSKLYEKYDYISVTDSEIIILKKDNYYSMMKSIVDNKIVAGGKILDTMSGQEKIIRVSLSAITPKKDQEKLKKISQEHKLYTWWVNLPVFDCKIAKHFLEWIDFKSSNINRFSWFVFEHLLYNFFCIMFYKYKFHLIPDCRHSLEFSNTELVENVDKNITKLYWVNHNAYNQNKAYYDNNNFYVVFHIDRQKFPIF